MGSQAQYVGGGMAMVGLCSGSAGSTWACGDMAPVAPKRSDGWTSNAKREYDGLSND